MVQDEKEKLANERRELVKSMPRWEDILRGSVLTYFLPCGKKGCRCKIDKDSLHGPYYYISVSEKGKTRMYLLGRKRKEAAYAVILYLEKAYGLGRGIVKEHFQTIKSLGIKPWAIIFDMRACFPKAAKTVFGKDVIIQHDYFHVMKIIHYHLNRAMAEYRRILKEQGVDTLDVWLARWVILKNMERWSVKEHRIIENLL
jgi:hypothetical protein